MEPEEFMKDALELAEEAYNLGEVPVGAIFVHDGKIIATGRNRTNEKKNGTRHAEMEAIDYIVDNIENPKWNEVSVVVTIEPCIMCAAALRTLGIQRVFFGAHNERFGGCGSILSLHNEIMDDYPPFDISSGIFAKDAILLLRKFYIRENLSAPEPKRKTGRILKDEDLLDV